MEKLCWIAWVIGTLWEWHSCCSQKPKQIRCNIWCSGGPGVCNMTCTVPVHKRTNYFHNTKRMQRLLGLSIGPGAGPTFETRQSLFTSPINVTLSMSQFSIPDMSLPRAAVELKRSKRQTATWKYLQVRNLSHFIFSTKALNFNPLFSHDNALSTQRHHRLFPGWLEYMAGKFSRAKQAVLRLSQGFNIKWTDLNSNILLPPRGRKKHVWMGSEWPGPLHPQLQNWTSSSRPAVPLCLWEMMFKTALFKVQRQRL